MINTKKLCKFGSIIGYIAGTAYVVFSLIPNSLVEKVHEEDFSSLERIAVAGMGVVACALARYTWNDSKKTYGFGVNRED